MSNYVKATNFATKDTLPTGDANKIVKGTEIDNEFNSIAGAVSSKSDIASPTFTGTPAAPTATAGSSTTQIATTAFVTAALQALYPLGSIYVNAASSSNPATLLGFGTWEAFGAGRVMVGFNSSDALFDTLEETGGSKDSIVVSHTHSVTDPGHQHKYRLDVNGADIAIIGNQGDLGGATLPEGGGARNSISTSTQSSTTSVSVNSTGSSGTNANIQPYITVRMWKRTA